MCLIIETSLYFLSNLLMRAPLKECFWIASRGWWRSLATLARHNVIKANNANTFCKLTRLSKYIHQLMGNIHEAQDKLTRLFPPDAGVMLG